MKTKVTLERPDGSESEMDCDGVVMVAWNLNPDGTKAPVLVTSPTPFDEDGSDVVGAVGALAILMTRHTAPGIQVMGELVKAAMAKGLAELKAAVGSDIPDA